MRELAQAARQLGAVDCEQLYLKAAVFGDESVLKWFIRRLITLRHFERAEQIIENHCLDGFLLGELSAALGLAGLFKDAERLARRAYEVSGNDSPHVISARGLTFTYPGSDRPAVDHVDLDLKRGEIIALVGENCSGKTTLVHLLTGLYMPDAGTVAWDSISLTDVSPTNVWRRVAMPPQEYTRWPLTARDNITLGNPNGRGDLAVLAAARASGADQVLRQLPDGLDASLARSWWGGHDLSGGQWQRIALARSFHAHADLHVLDEPTAALDARAERQVFDQFHDLAAGRTALVITHRLANARIADRIVVMDHGQIIESGSYKELLAQGGQFAQLHQLQDGAEADSP